MHRIIGPISLISALAITGCATVTESMPTVQIVRKETQSVAAVMAKYEQANTVQRAEAPMVCDNANMRARAADNDSNNDSARVLILEESDRSNTVLADVVVNCKDYFENAGQWRAANWDRAAQPAAAIPATTVATEPSQTLPQTNVIQANQAMTRAAEQRRYTVRTGDNLYRIARGYCTDTETLASINAIADPTQIKPGQVLRLPETGC